MRYTFVVCVSCGTQSPPLLIDDDQPLSLKVPLAAMGWKFDRLRFTALATCPHCADARSNDLAAAGS